MSLRSQGIRGKQMIDLLGLKKVTNSSDKCNNNRNRTLKRKNIISEEDRFSNKNQDMDPDSNSKCRKSKRIAQRIKTKVKPPDDENNGGRNAKRVAQCMKTKVKPVPIADYENIEGNENESPIIQENAIVETVEEICQSPSTIPVIQEITVSEPTPIVDSTLICPKLELELMSPTHEVSEKSSSAKEQPSVPKATNFVPVVPSSTVQEKIAIEMSIANLLPASKCPTLRELAYQSFFTYQSSTYLAQEKTVSDLTNDSLIASHSKDQDISTAKASAADLSLVLKCAERENLESSIFQEDILYETSAAMDQNLVLVPSCAIPKVTPILSSSPNREENGNAKSSLPRNRKQSISPTLKHANRRSVEIEKNASIVSKNNFASVRSLSLSDLTEDKKNDYGCVRRCKSVSISDKNFHPESPSLMLSYYSHISDVDESEGAEYVPSICSTSIGNDGNLAVDYGDLNEGRKRSHISNPETWKKKRAKKQRMLGEEYLGFRKTINGKVEQDVVKPQREVGPMCESDFCKKSKLRGCDRFTEETRRQINRSFWKNLNWDQRKIYVTNLVSRSATSRKTSEENSRREGTLKYYLPLKVNGEEKIQVCREMFLSTLSLGSFTVQNWVKNATYMMLPNKEVNNALVSTKKKQNPNMTRKLLTLENFLNNLPKLPSHYARKDTNKLFIEPAYQSKTELFNCYKKYCSENEEPQVSRYTFDEKFREKNLSLYELKKDMCDVCVSHKAGNLNEVDYQIHINKKERARREKDVDKEKAIKGEFILLTLDLEAVKVCPYLTASALYFKTKLTCHNYTIYDLVTHHSSCYWFDETGADLTSSTFASCLIDYLQRHCLERQLPIIIYSDGCTYQNRNVVLANALLHFSKTHGVTIIQKYLEPGHTQMECDSVHSTIERKLKKKEIYLPSDYIRLTREARKDNPYETICVDHTFIKNYADTKTHVYKSIRPGRKAGDPQVVDIRAILYKPDLTLQVKLDFDSEWINLPLRPKQILEVEYQQLHTSRIPISITKYNHLQQLKTVIPSDCHGFYDSLPFLP